LKRAQRGEQRAAARAPTACSRRLREPPPALPLDPAAATTAPHPRPRQLRALNIVVRLGTYFGALAWDRVTGSEDTPEVVRLRAQQLRDMLTVLGPSFIKAGQVLANRPDIVREDYMNELCVLQVGLGLGWGLGVEPPAGGFSGWNARARVARGARTTCRPPRFGTARTRTVLPTSTPLPRRHPLPPKGRRAALPRRGGVRHD
jgi:hypothetical protein